MLQASYDDIHSWINDLAAELRRAVLDLSDYTVVGMSRGGLIPGVILSHTIDRPFIPIVYSSAQGRGETKSRQCLRTTSMLPSTRKILLVDDIADTGLTMKEVKEQYEEMGFEVKTVALHVRKKSFDVDFVKHDVMNDAWVIYPWEAKG